MKLSAKQRQDLRSKAHSLKPVVIIGAKGVTKTVLRELEVSIKFHELIKVKIAGSDKDDRKKASDYLCSYLKCELIQSIGNILILYKENIN